MSRFSTLVAAATLLLFSPDLAAAHTGGALGGFGAGLAHPLTGLDHALAMVSFGALAAQIGGRARWIVPMSFVAVMLLGGWMGTGGASLPAVELFIALSVGITGLALAGARLRSAAVLAAAAAGFTLFHGHAHGAEMAVGSSVAAYGAGMVLATALLQGAGLALVDGAGRLAGGRAGLLVRLGGGAVAAVGLVLLMRVI